MANSTKENKKNSATDSSNKLTADELKNYYEKHHNTIEAYEKALEAFQLANPNKSSTNSFNVFSKEKLRTFLKNPLRYAKDLRNLSRFLYYRSHPYRRMIKYNAQMINLEFRQTVPLVDLNRETDKTKMIKSYYETLKFMENSNLTLEFLKAYTTCWIEDVFFGCAYWDDEGNLFILPLDPDFCQVVGTYQGDLMFAMDMTYFRGKDGEGQELEMYGEPFVSMYKAYGGNNTNRWQIFDPKYAVCLKVNIDNIFNNIPPFLGMFNSIINLSDLEDIQAVADEQSIYKMLVSEIPTLRNTDEVNDFAVDPVLAIKYYNEVNERLPDYTTHVISPVPIKDISFDKDAASDTTSYQKAVKAVYTNSGGANTLYSSDVQGTTAHTHIIKLDEDNALSSLLPQTEKIVNRLLSYRLSNPAKIKFLETTTYTKDIYIENLIKTMNYGLPFATTIGVMQGISELELLSMAELNKALDIQNLFTPLETASTRSSEDTKNTKGESEITNDGEASIDKRDRSG